MWGAAFRGAGLTVRAARGFHSFNRLRGSLVPVAIYDDCYNFVPHRREISWGSSSRIKADSEGRPVPEPEPEPVKKKEGIVARFKQMYKDYWYVLVPVHIVTSAGWIGSFYYLAKSGVDVVALLKSLGLSERFTDPLKDSSMGYWALAYALYKVATPIRYTVTIGGTTISIKYLQGWGYIKPMPSKEQLKEMYQVKKESLQERYNERKDILQEKYNEKKESFQEKYNETREELKQRTDLMKEKKDQMMNDIKRYKEEMDSIKEGKVKNKDL